MVPPREQRPRKARAQEAQQAKRAARAEGPSEDLERGSEARPSELTQPAGCYTTGRFHAGRIVFAEAVVARLVRDAHALGLGELDPERCLRRLLELGRTSFGARGEGVVRLEARRGQAGLELIGTTRPLGAEPTQWHAITAPVAHPGPGPVPGAKRAAVAELDAAREAAARAGVDEALLFDVAGRLVEGARTNLALALAGGQLVTPPLARGAVRGVALLAAREAGLALVERDVSREEVRHVREIVATNAARGARAIVSLDGRPIGDGVPGALHAALAGALARAG